MNDRLLSLLGICRRARKLAIGAQVCVESAESGRAELIVCAADFSQGSLRSVAGAAQRCGVKLIRLPRSKEELSLALGKLCGVAAVEDKGFARKIEEILVQSGELRVE